MSRLGWAIAPWFQPIWYVYVAFCWWQVGAAEAGRQEQATHALVATPTIAGALTAAGKLSGFLVETAFYRLFWKSRARHLPFWRFFCVVVSASMADLFALSIADLARRHPGSLELWLAPVAGLDLADGRILGSAPALRAAFGTVGFLAAVRLLLTAVAQARALELPLRAVLGWTFAAWLLTRIAILWSVDLLTGMSPVTGS